MLMETNSNNGWAEYKRLVVKELEDLREWCGHMQDSINKININIAVLMVKVALIATVSGVIAAGVVSFVVRYLSK